MAKQEKFTNTSSQENSSFSKGMFKDLSDTYMSEGMWNNAINAINNSHKGESGNIGNEMSNKECASAPYTIIGMAHKTDKQWVLYSTDNTDSEIGIFDEATCSYQQVVNDQCLNFNKANLITAVVKENYDCTHSAYWQDNLNPDRVLNLDDIPLLCTEIIEETNVNYYNYTLSLPGQPSVNCGDAPAEAQLNAEFEQDYELGSDWGEVVLEFNAAAVPDRFQVFWNGSMVIDTGYVGDGNYDCLPGVQVYSPNQGVHQNYPDLGSGTNTGLNLTTTGSVPSPMGFYVSTGGQAQVPLIVANNAGGGTASFKKDQDEGTVTVKVIPGNPGTGAGQCGNTGWKFKLRCVEPIPGLVRSSEGATYSYIDVNNVSKTETLAAGATVDFCALEGSFVQQSGSDLLSVSVSNATCDTGTIVDDDATTCAKEVCTTLDCEALRLHPLVTQPCVQIKKAQGSGQVQNGSYMAVIAYSENGIKLTDYSTPTYPAAIWDHTGIGGGLEVNISNLDKDFEEYELVIIGIVNQNTVAKRIGFYSIDQTKVTVDIIAESLVTIDIRKIPLTSSIYEKSERMSTVNGYLIRSGVKTQPAINYQPLANKIEAEWTVTSYEDGYYRDGGNNVGYMRDEVYTFFIRWRYQTGNYTSSFHIPGRPAKASDLSVVEGDDVIEPGQNRRWQVYDTSSQNFSSTYDTASVIDSEFDGRLTASGEMGFWQSTERYPNKHPEVWNSTYTDPVSGVNVGNTSNPDYDLCRANIRHHKMPSNITTHIHQDNGDYINVLGVRFKNVEHPVDDKGEKIKEIVGYEILRGSREGNRSIIAKGMFGNMREFPYNLNGDNSDVKFGLYQNYPYNDLRTDNFLTLWNYVFNNGDAENRAKPDPGPGASLAQADDAVKYFDHFGLSVYKKNYLSFHSPETTFIKPFVGSGAGIRIYTEEHGTAEGSFRLPYKHPKYILITDASFVAAFAVGVGIGLLDAIGGTKLSSNASISVGFLGSGVEGGINSERGGGSSVFGAMTDAIIGGATNPLGVAGLIAGAIGFIARFNYYAGTGTNSVLRLIRAAVRPKDYVLQINSSCTYNQSKPLDEIMSRKSFKSGTQYIGRGVQRFNQTYVVNNLNRNKFVCIKLTADVPDPTIIDESRQRLVDLADTPQYDDDEVYERPDKVTYDKTASGYYGAVKFDFENQYGQIRSIQQIPISICIEDSKADKEGNYQILTSNILHGGDVYINRFTEKNPYYYFNSWLYDVPDETTIDYRDYVNGPLPRYWANFSDFNYEDFQVQLDGESSDSTGIGASDVQGLQASEYDGGTNTTQDDQGDDESNEVPDEADLDEDTKGVLKTIRDFISDLKNKGVDEFLVTPSDKHRLDRRKRVSGFWRVKESWMYLFNNGLKDFYCESELNMAFRNWSDELDFRFHDVYNYSFNDVDLMFRSDKITNPTKNLYDLSLSSSRLFNQFFSWGRLFPRDYNPKLYSTCFEYFPNRSIYSLKQSQGQKRDNWRNFLALNYKDLQGRVSTIKSLNKAGAVILFEDAEPVLFTGTDTIQTQGGTKYTIGDGALFAENNMKSMVNADDQLAFGTCISSRSAINTPHGLFFISQDSGKIFQYSSQMIEISKNGMKHWFAENLPNKIREADPDYILYDNPVVGTGCQAIYDPTYELVYFTKKGYNIVDGAEPWIYDAEDGIPYTLSTTVDNVTPPTSTSTDCEEGCPEEYDRVQDKCIKYEYSEPTLVGGTPLTLDPGQNNSGYGFYGLILFGDITNYVLPVGGKQAINPAYSATDLFPESAVKIYDNRGNGVEVPAIETSIKNEIWGNGSTSNGRLNEVGIDIGTSGIPVCFTVCIDVPETRQYVVAAAGDNEISIQLDGNEIFATNACRETDDNDFVTQCQTKAFKRWWAFAITLTKGSHRIKLCGENEVSTVSSFAAEIYNMTLAEFQSSPGFLSESGTLSQLTPNLNDINSPANDKILWSTGMLIGTETLNPLDPGVYFCNGVELETEPCANTPSCESILEANLSTCVSCSLTAISGTQLQDKKDGYYINKGGDLVLNWTSTNGTLISNFGQTATSGTHTVTNITSNTTFWIQAVDSAGLTSVCSLSVKLKEPCSFEDDTCFEKADWTVSYDPKGNGGKGAWISFHDWHPNLLMPSNQHFNSIQDKTIWQHNDDYNSYNNYYGKNYGWEIEYPIMNPPAITTLRNIEYVLEVHEYSSNGRDRLHILDENFDRAVLYNSEQISGLLKLNIKGKNSPKSNLSYPSVVSGDIVGSSAYDILYSKEENKYRFNQFWDTTKNRGEFTANSNLMFNTKDNGYQKDINESYVDYNKKLTQRKKFRHYGNRLILRRFPLATGVDNKKMVLKLVTSKQLLSRM